MTREQLLKRIKETAYLEGDFTLRSGKKSKYYVDIKRASSRPEILSKMISGFKDLGIDCDKVAGMELGAVALIVAYSLKTDLPFLIIRKGGREHGTKRKIEGDIKPGEKILLLEDVVTSGGSVIQAIDIVEEAGGEVVAVLTVVDREEGTVAAQPPIGQHRQEGVDRRGHGEAGSPVAGHPLGAGGLQGRQGPIQIGREFRLGQAEEDGMDEMVHQVFQKGYMFKDQLVRPARVSVYKDDD